MIGAGIQTTATTVIGNKIGSGEKHEAYEYFKAVVVFSSCTFLL
jgi:Na+-driven multidrug efflux pump